MKIIPRMEIKPLRIIFSESFNPTFAPKIAPDSTAKGSKKIFQKDGHSPEYSNI